MGDYVINQTLNAANLPFSIVSLDIACCIKIKCNPQKISNHYQLHLINYRVPNINFEMMEFYKLRQNSRQARRGCIFEPVCH